MKRPKRLTKKERKAQLPTRTVQAASLPEALAGLGPYDVALLGVDAADPLVRQVHRAMAKPDLRNLLENPEPMQCWLYAQTLYSSLDDTAGWEFRLLLQNDDYHISLCHGDVFADFAPDGNPDVRMIYRIPRSEHDEQMRAAGGVVTYHPTFDGVVRAAQAAGFDVRRP